MTRRKGNQSRVAQQTADKSHRWTVDSFANFEARVGIDTDNQASRSSYQFDFISRNRNQLEAMYRSSWVVGQVVDVVADDMTRAGIDVTAGLDADDKAKMNTAFERLFLWDRINDAIKWARLYGGAVAVMLIDGQRMDSPLRTETIRPGQFKGLFVMDRWLMQPSLSELIRDLGPEMGRPMFYDVVADGMALQRQRIHHSRVIRFDGVDLPYWQSVTENLWGQSIVERLYDRLVAFDSTTAGAAQLVYKAHLRTFKVKGLKTVLAAGGPALEGLLKNVDMIRRFQSNEGITLIDADDEINALSYAFTGLDNVLLQFGQQLSGATGIPLVRLFGQSPAGLNATGDSDIRLYYDNVKKDQERKLRNPITVLLDVLCRSELGMAEPPEDLAFGFNALWQLSDTEKADIAQKDATSIGGAYELGLITQQRALEELRNSAQVSGRFASITDEEINDADTDPPAPEADGPEETPGADGQEGGKPVRPAAS